MENIMLAFIVAFAAGILEWDIYGWGQTMISRPIVVGAVIGAILGDITTGLFIGASIEFIYLGTIPVGAAIPPDPTTATAIAVAVGILSGIDSSVAVTLAIPVAIAAQMMQMAIWTINSGLMHRADKAIQESPDFNKTDRIQYLGSFFFFLQGFIPVFLALVFGVDIVKDIVENIPIWLTEWFRIAGGVLPALGFAMLYVMMGSKKMLPFFIIGFVFATFFNASLISIAGIGLAAALLYVNTLNTKTE